MGAYLLRQERAVLAEALPTIFGYFLVQAGLWGPAGTLLQSSPILTHFVLGQNAAAGVQLCGDPGYLPFAGDPWMPCYCPIPWNVSRMRTRYCAKPSACLPVKAISLLWDFILGDCGLYDSSSAHRLPGQGTMCAWGGCRSGSRYSALKQYACVIIFSVRRSSSICWYAARFLTDYAGA